ncbi:pyruvate formate lyase family protein [Irregularibacter muris]|uniref:Pyruvate formate lyase family protein n=1 Tax=Irregularibacter muris TaxID=1796619 RepID=A0AAE3HIC5_9FIRM|nr:pyruvate formate lyase family protein [Irregularibacter muris]MCR1899123.1 pyruvate formate lyase family protein [Irregularibacter muris]
MEENVYAEQVEVNIKIECEKAIDEQLEIMEQYTNVHRENLDAPREVREIRCLNVLYPRLFRKIEESDLVIGRLDALPIGFGCVTSIGGVGHYCNFNKLDQFKDSLTDEAKRQRVEKLREYWEIHDTRSIFFKETLTGTTLGKFVDNRYPAIITARLSGMYLDYNKLIDLGIPGLRKEINHYKTKIQDEKSLILYHAFEEVLNLLIKTIDYHIHLATEEQKRNDKRRQEMGIVIETLNNIKKDKPKTFMEGVQLSWLYSLLSSVVNYGRMDDYLGELLVKDLEIGRITENKAKEMIKSLFKLIEARKTTVNGRVVIGGRGRRNPEIADIFCKLAIQAVKENKDTEPQFTLRIYEGMNDKIYNAALDSIGEGTTYPVLYNDDINIPAVMKSMKKDEKTAQHYVPFGCGEFVLSGMSVGTPNTCLNLLKILNISLNAGIDPWDGLDKSGEIQLLSYDQMETFEDVFHQYKRLLDYYIDRTAQSQAFSYKVMNQECSFLFTSLLTKDCLGRGRSLLDGGVRYLGGTNETYGNINAADSLSAIKKVVFEDRKYSLKEVLKAMNHNFKGYEDLRNKLLDAPKYGNDEDYVDSIAVELHEYVCSGVSNAAQKVGLDSYLVVMINNQVNTEWGRGTSASADGRLTGMYMSNGNNPQSGADKNGPTAMLNSLAKLRADIHAGSVQNIKFSKGMFNNKREVIKALFKTYFANGGPQLMVSVVGREELEEAYRHPERYPNLLVRVGGFSARFVNLDRDVQEEVLARTLND